MSFVIFPAGPADAEALARVHVRSWRETYRGVLPDACLARMSVQTHAQRWRQDLTRAAPGEITLAAADREGLVGYAGAAPSRSGRPGEGEIQTLYLLNAAQGMGLGRRLVGAAARALATQGSASLMISVLRDNPRARGFYAHLGGVPDPERREPGPGGVVVEVAYRWADIAALTG